MKERKIKSFNIKRIKNVFIVSLMILVLTLATGCTTYDNFKAAWFTSEKEDKPVTLKIGVYEPFSGQYKKYGREEIEGITVAYNRVNNVIGKKIELIKSDNKSNIYDADTAIKHLMTLSPSVVLGSYGETLSLVASDYLKATDTPGITISSTNPLVTKNNDYYFMATFSDTKQGSALAEYAFGKKREIVATVRQDTDDTAQAIIKRFTSRTKKLNENEESVAGNFIVNHETLDYSKTIEDLRISGAKAILVTLPPNATVEFLNQCVKNNFTHAIFLGTKNFNDNAVQKYIREKNKLYVAYIEENSAIETNKEFDRFMEEYKKTYGDSAEPTLNTLVAYDSYMIAVKSIKKAYNDALNADVEALVKAAPTAAEANAVRKEIDTVKKTGIPSGRLIKEAIKSIKNYHGVSGIINYQGKSEPSKSISITTVINGTEEEPVVVLA